MKNIKVVKIIIVICLFIVSAVLMTSCSTSDSDSLFEDFYNWLFAEDTPGNDTGETPDIPSDDTEPCKHLELEIVDGQQPTCTEAGFTSYTKCKNCFKVIKPSETVLPYGHAAGEVVPAKSSTCITKGHSAYTKCSECDEILDGYVEYDLEPHTYDPLGLDTYKCFGCGVTHNTIKLGAAAATCTVPGETGDTVCKDCHIVLFESSSIPAKGHTSFVVKELEATCEHEGFSSYTKCSECDVHLTEPEVLPKIACTPNEMDICTKCGKKVPIQM